MLNSFVHHVVACLPRRVKNYKKSEKLQFVPGSLRHTYIYNAVGSLGGKTGGGRVSPKPVYRKSKRVTFVRAAIRLFRVHSSTENDSLMARSRINSSASPAASRESTRPGTAAAWRVEFDRLFQIDILDHHT